MRLVIAPLEARDLEFDDTSGVEFPLEYGGLFFFLWPFLLHIEEATGERIDPQSIAYFPAGALAVVARYLHDARRAAADMPETFEQHVGRQILPESKEEFHTVSRAELLQTLDHFSSMVSEAASSGRDLWLVGS